MMSINTLDKERNSLNRFDSERYASTQAKIHSRAPKHLRYIVREW